MPREAEPDEDELWTNAAAPAMVVPCWLAVLDANDDDALPERGPARDLEGRAVAGGLRELIRDTFVAVGAAAPAALDIVCIVSMFANELGRVCLAVS